MSTQQATIVHVSIERPVDRVYEIARNPKIMPQWATGLASGLIDKGDHFLVKAPFGTATLRFAPPNSFGILDHWVTVDGGATTYNSMRVVANGTGTEVMFTLLRTPDMTDEDYARDVAWVHDDLTRLKTLIESAI